MPTCCKDITVTIGSTGCPGGANGTDPTPNTLQVTADVVIDSISVPSTNGGMVAQLPWFSGVPVGSYKIEYVSGFIPWQSTDLACLPVTLDIVGDSTGDIAGSHISSWGMNFQRITAPFTVVFANFVGLECGVCGLVDTCNTADLQTNTAALNPVAIFLVDSATFGRNGGDVASCPMVGCDTLGGSTFRGAGLETWRIVQTQHVYDQPACVRIKDYAAVKAILGVCPDMATEAVYCAAHPAKCAGPTTEWDGRFPERRVFYPNAANNQVNFYPSPEGTDEAIFTLNGIVLATTITFETAIHYRSVAGVGFWTLDIIGYLDPAIGYIQSIWHGEKTTGTDPIGEYTFNNSAGSCKNLPLTICVEACP